MTKGKVQYCSDCGESTLWSLVSSKSDFEGLGLARGLLAVTTLGVSETFCREKWYQCQKCGKLRRG